MLASKEDEYLNEASETIFRMSADNLVRKRYRDREEYYQDLCSYERKIEQNLRNYEQKIEQNRRNYEAALAERDAQIQQLQAKLDALKKQST